MTSIGTAALRFKLLMVLVLFAAAAWADEQVDCGGASSVQNFGQFKTSDPICMADETRAIEAAKYALKEVMVAPTGVTCNNEDCTPSSCHTAIWYWNPAQLIIHSVPDGELYCVTAEWAGGEYQVICTDCNHI